MRQFSRSVLFLCILNCSMIGFLIFYLQTHAKYKMTRSAVVRNDIGKKPLILFADVLSFPIQFCLIEPKFLWDLLSNKKQQLLRKKGFSFESQRRTEDLITIAVRHEDLDAALKTTEIAEQTPGTKIWIVRSPSPSWMRNTSYPNGRFVSHLLIQRHSTFLHITILYQRSNYFWIGKMKSEVQDLPNDASRFHFGQHESVLNRFEFSTDPLTPETPFLFVPSDVPEFLFRVQSARFVPCLGIASEEDEEAHEDRVPRWLFRRTLVEAMEELGALMGPSPVWLASGTLLGWYRNCDVIPYTHDVDFAAWAKDIDDDLISAFRRHSQLRLLKMLGQEKVDLEFWLIFKWLRVDLFFVYSEKAGEQRYYAGGHRPEEGYSFRYMLPSFVLCSGDLFGRLVLVPCDPESVLAAEYGEDWRKPVRSWNYELSARNVFGRRYWKQEEILGFRNER